MIIHIGHHFFGAGNLGDDLMLGGFLAAIPPHSGIELSCCVPFDRARLENRFPLVKWLPYDEATRVEAIRTCDVWLGLGGSPFQCSVSRWFIDHLEQERALCRRFDKPMDFLGVGGQDPDAYVLPEIKSLCQQAEHIWTRDAHTANILSGTLGSSKVTEASDISHIWLSIHRPNTAAKGRIVVTVNFDYQNWPPLNSLVTQLSALPARERLWVAQEQRPLPGAEIALHASLQEAQRAQWKLVEIDPVSSQDNTTGNNLRQRTLIDCTNNWPTGEWLLSSRFHSAIVGAWAGSKILVLETNLKLKDIAKTLDCKRISLDEKPADIAKKLERATPVSDCQLNALAEKAKDSCKSFFHSIGLTP